ncbi:DNA-binding response regulator [Niameybacter massiliensis]|uniref:Stage 0 sporulation protein A homolog n=1 Tax=Holtiella tumoricola TaxID=3018743 RepID=A0AA42DMX2_9FIRM|nr:MULTISPECIES: helix-turn-helix domain-containing protein [Lachnospirales]MDA3731918.1 DNA-binding response regulator [Holtiella tumoricola]
MFRLLIVDDEPEIVDSLENLIKEKCKYHVKIDKAYMPKEAIRLAYKQRVDVILSDMRMPGLTGIEMVKEITSREENKNAKVIFLTGYSDFDCLYDIAKSGQAKFILKNEEDEVIIEFIEKVLDEMPAERLIDSIEQTENTLRIIEACKQYIEENIDKDLSLQTIAERVNMNPSYLSRLFKKECGENLSHYIQQIKIKKAKELIEKGKLKMTDISVKLGFYSPTYFTTYFKRVTGYTPQHYRDACIDKNIYKKE